MSSDRPSNRKSNSKRAPASPTPPARKNLPKSRTAENLEALLHLLDDGATTDAASARKRKPQNAASGADAIPCQENSAMANDESPFMQELARARADLHQEHRSRVALEEEAETLRRECASLQQQIAALDKQRHGLQTARFDLESQLDAEQRQRELLIDQVDVISAQLTTARSRREKIAAELEAARQECASLKSELEAMRLSQEE
ncbi:MAG TPA: hypothetical protein VMM76_17085 [Pirellulaceae bacterium]|nr:hypothetical protein [Pirellulaceae bacterium]